ncbi:MAG: hypothetical protein AB1403_02945 [Candidatus Riflebacteria bacterium]
MTRKSVFIAMVLVALSFVPGFAAELEPIPSGANVVLLVNNHAGLPLGDLLNAVPLPPPAKQKLDEFFSATSFNPLEDVVKVQVMVKKGETKREDNAVIVLSGKFNQEKIVGFIKEKIGQAIDEEKMGNLTVYRSKDGKGGLCFIDGGKVAFGTLPAVKVFLEARDGKELSSDFDELKPILSDKAFVAVMVGGSEFMKKEMEKNREKRLARLEKLQRPQNPVARIMEEYITEGVEPTGFIAQLQSSRIEVKLSYRRGQQNNQVQASVEIADPKLTIEKLYGELVKALAEAPKPGFQPKAEEKAPSTGRW